MMKRKMNKNSFTTLRNFVMPAMEWYIRWYREGKSDEILRNCPALILFHCPVNEPAGPENCLVAAFHATLMAHVMNIGACLNGLIPPMCNRIPELGNLIGLSDDREIHAAITMGYPKYKFKKSIPRKLADVRYL
jgi:hypothetical protein